MAISKEEKQYFHFHPLYNLYFNNPSPPLKALMFILSIARVIKHALLNTSLEAAEKSLCISSNQ